MKKCGREGCQYWTLSPPRLPEDVFKAVNFLPDPVEGEDGSYLEFHEVYGKDTTDAARPGANRNPVPTETDKKLKNLVRYALHIKAFLF